MSNFAGGSVYSMVQGISSGSYLLTEKNFKRLLASEMQQLAAELERQVRLVRGDQPPMEDTAAQQQRHRTLQRLNSALVMLRAFQSRRKGS